MCRRLICWISFAVVPGLVGHASAAIPDGWSNRDIGTTGGSASEAGGTWTVGGDGADIWDTSDAFHYVYVPLSGNGQITARVVSYGTGSSRWSKGGVMIRETLSRGSKHAIMAITGGQGGGMAFQNRPTTGGSSFSAHGDPTVAPPYWVRLKREGDTITGYSSADGLHWVQQPNGTGDDATTNPVDIPMAADVFAGLFVTSHAPGEVRTYTFDNVTVERPVIALDPTPADSAIHLDTWATLTWTPGSTADSHDVYFGESFAEVNDGTEGTFQGNQPAPFFFIGPPEFPYPNGLVRGTTYYWRVDEVEADGVTKHRGRVWSFLVASEKAYNPVPCDGAKFVAPDVTLTWTAGLDAGRHTVYFGDDLDTVANARRGIPQVQTRYDPGALEFDKTYYWRVDELDSAVTHKGDIWSFTTTLPGMSWAAVYYVDGENRAARDANPGTEARPWKTIGKGTSLLRPGEALMIKAGVYRENVILTQSGTETHPIRLMAYPGDEGEVIINAAEPVTNWQKCAGPDDCAANPYWDRIYYADVKGLVESHPDAAFAIRQVFQHGELLNRSRYPNSGWSYPTIVLDPQTVFSDRSLTQPDGYFTNAICHIKTEVWQPDQIDIVDYSKYKITLATKPRYEISTRFGYYITNVVGEINEEGEWAYDPVLKRLFIWPKEERAENIEVTYRDYCLRTHGGVSSNEVQGLTMHNAYRYGIWLYRANDMRVEDNTVEHSYDCGIYVQAQTGRCENNQIINNTVRYSCCNGIVVDRTAYNNNVEGNYVYAIGAEHYGDDLMHGRGEGIYVSGPFTRVYNNRIDRTGHTSIYLLGKAADREISYNYVTNTCLSLSDSAGIYMGSSSDGPEKDYIHHNICEDIIGCLSMDRVFDTGGPPTVETHSGAAPGIYIDGEGNNRMIEHNTVIRSRMAGIYLHWAPSNVVKNNTLYGNEVAQVWFSGKNEAGQRLENDDLSDNVMYATDPGQKTFLLGMNYDNVRFGRADNNYFYNPHADRHIRVSRYIADEGRTIHENLTLDGWRALSGYDGDSKDFAHLGQFSDMTVDSEIKSRIVYNASLETVSIDLGSDKYCDVEGNKIYGSISLQPFESKILISCDFEIPDTP